MANKHDGDCKGAKIKLSLKEQPKELTRRADGDMIGQSGKGAKETEKW